MFFSWIKGTLNKKPEYSKWLDKIDDLGSIKVMLADRLEEWAHGYMAEGKQEGETLLLQKLLAKRFGTIPAETTALISNAPVVDIERWFDRAIDAKQLSDVFVD